MPLGSWPASWQTPGQGLVPDAKGSTLEQEIDSIGIFDDVAADAMRSLLLGQAYDPVALQRGREALGSDMRAYFDERVRALPVRDTQNHPLRPGVEVPKAGEVVSRSELEARQGFFFNLVESARDTWSTGAWMGKRGLIVAGGVVAVGGLAYGIYRWARS